jgi:hypothetical protein
LDEEIQFVDYALAGKARKKVKDKRILIVGKYRVYFFGRGKKAEKLV